MSHYFIFANIIFVTGIKSWYSFAKL